MGSYARSYHDVIMYWKGVRDALKMPPPPLQSSLVNGFWPSTCIQSSENDTLLVDRIVQVLEEFEDDKPFIGLVGEQPCPSF